MLRAFIKTTAAEAACRIGANRLLGALAPPAGRPLVLGYHRVVEDCARSAAHSIPAMLISTRMLEQQLDWVGRRFRFVSLDELGEGLESGARPGRPPAAVTFDDGYRDVYTHAYPLLRRKGIPAAVFVVTDLVGTSRLFAHDRLYLLMARAFRKPACGPRFLARLLGDLGLRVDGGAAAGTARDAFGATRALLEALPSSELEQVMHALAAELGPAEEDLPELRPLAWEMVAEMHRAGFTIGSHTCSHVLLTLEGPDRMRLELAASRRRLEGELGASVRHFAYPDGRFDDAVVEAVGAAGYRFGYTTCRHRDRRHPLLTVPRRLLWENSCLDTYGRFSPSLMHCQVHGLFDLFGRCRQAHRSASSGCLQPMTA